MNRLYRFVFYRLGLYPAVMRLAHRYHWHYAPPIYPDGDTQLWCKWCGFRETIHQRGVAYKTIDDAPAAQVKSNGR